MNLDDQITKAHWAKPGHIGSSFSKLLAKSRIVAWLRLAQVVFGYSVLVFCVAENYAQAQPVPLFQTLHSFTNGTDGDGPYASLVISGTTLYGTAVGGGTDANGTVFALDTDGTDFRVLHSFSALESAGPELLPTNSGGAEPYGGLVLSNNTLYGTTFAGGAGTGTVFAVNTDGTSFGTVYNFTDDGGWCYAGVIINGSTLYGTSQRMSLQGDVFAVKTDGTGYTVLHGFSGASDGSEPYGDLLLSGNTLYGTASGGGSNGLGTVFAVNTNGTGFTVLHSFSGPPDGGAPYCNLVLSGNTLYGTTAGGGTNSYGTVFALYTDGTGLRILHAFGSTLDGASPSAGLVLSGNMLYGTTPGGGTSSNGTVFAVNTDGTGYTILHSFVGSDGALPYAGLVLSGNTLYGTTWQGGAANYGTVFAITLASAPAIETNSMSAIGGQLQFVVGGLTPDATVYLQANSNLGPAGNWVPVATNLASGTNLTISGLSVTNANYRFFRVLETYPP